jgi:hypothetical protein
MGKGGKEIKGRNKKGRMIKKRNNLFFSIS